MQKQWHTDNPLQCPLVAAVNVIGGKWKTIILHMLMSGTMRFGELQKQIPPISQKMLTQQLRELEVDGVIERTVYAVVPPRVEYSLSAKGAELAPILSDLYSWGEQSLRLNSPL
ncbi:helix-turn-helix transcriptional regulator [Chitinimonas arctica]|uniref:Helix-turn-helix transcriptional regulator n=1 Tax=Chitinimonas arctica TaxID=2594795 RepID=A0A516SC03_9NEIS|nr:helix-turn-helix domain-containing protein [Chitinimonas arctica]QDQ25673.1 helix-turn-helix transcriptional regulator [Chitinimonas arctica]